MRKEHKQEIGRLLDRLVDALHPDNYDMMTLGYYQELRRQANQAKEDLNADKGIR